MLGTVKGGEGTFQMGHWIELQLGSSPQRALDWLFKIFPVKAAAEGESDVRSADRTKPLLSSLITVW